MGYLKSNDFLDIKNITQQEINNGTFSPNNLSAGSKTHDNKNAISIDTTENFVSLIEGCDLARFTPISSDAMQQDYDKAVRVISEIDKAVQL